MTVTFIFVKLPVPELSTLVSPPHFHSSDFQGKILTWLSV